MIKIYGHPASTCTRKVLMTLAENEIPFDLGLVDFAKGEHKQQPHLSRQPFGRIPALDHDGFQLFESRAIARYLDQTAGGKLTPTDAKIRAQVEKWISIETSELSAHAMKFVYEHVFKRPQTPEVLETARKALGVTLGVMDEQLAKTRYLAGDAFTLADVVYMPYFDYALTTPVKVEFEKHANVMRWWNEISARPAWGKVTGRA